MDTRSKFVRISGAILVIVLLMLGSHSEQRAQARVQQATVTGLRATVG